MGILSALFVEIGADQPTTREPRSACCADVRRAQEQPRRPVVHFPARWDVAETSVGLLARINWYQILSLVIMTTGVYLQLYPPKNRK